MYTIGSFLREEELTGLKLMTDTADLQAEITNINIIDNPDSYDWLSSGDFLLTTGYFFRDDEAMQRQLVRELSELDRALNFLGGVKAYRRISNSECQPDDDRESDCTR